jgi:hypothetical protein
LHIIGLDIRAHKNLCNASVVSVCGLGCASGATNKAALCLGRAICTLWGLMYVRTKICTIRRRWMSSLYVLRCIYGATIKETLFKSGCCTLLGLTYVRTKICVMTVLFPCVGCVAFLVQQSKKLCSSQAVAIAGLDIRTQPRKGKAARKRLRLETPPPTPWCMVPLTWMQSVSAHLHRQPTLAYV